MAKGVNRYLQPQLFQYQSQFVPTNIPWEAIQGNIDRKQTKRDQFTSTVGASGVEAAGINYVTDHYGNPSKLGDYDKSLEASNAYNEKLTNFAKEFANTELNKDHYSKFAELLQERQKLMGENTVRTQRQQYIEEQNKQRITSKVNPGDARDIQYQLELKRMQENPYYVPTVHGIQEAINETDFVKDAVGDIKANMSAGERADGLGYIRGGKTTYVTRDKVLNSLTGAFEANKQMQEYVGMMATQQADLMGANDVNQKIPLQDGTEISIYDYTKQKYFSQLMQNAEKYIFEENQSTLTTDSTAISRLKEKEQIKANLPIITPNITKTKTSGEITKEGWLRKGKYEKVHVELGVLRTQLAKLDETNPDHAEDISRLEREIIAKESFKNSYEQNYNRVITDNLDKNKKALSSEIDTAKDKLNDIIHRYKNLPENIRVPGSVKGEPHYQKNPNKPSEQEYKNAVSQLEKTNALSSKLNTIQDAKELDKLIQGTPLERDYEYNVQQDLNSTDIQSTYYGVTYDAGTPTGKQLNEKVFSYLRSSEYDFEGVDGERVSFKSGEFLPGFQTGTMPDGRTFITVTEEQTVFGTKRNKTKTIIVDKGADFFNELVDETNRNAKYVYEESGGTDKYAAELYNNTLEIRANNTPIVGESALDTMGKLSDELASKNPDQMVSGMIQTPKANIMVTGTKLADGRIDARFSTKEILNGKPVWVEIDPNGLHIYSDLQSAILDKTNPKLK